MSEWLLANSNWLGFPLMALLGGTIAHILAFETSNIKWAFSQHFWLLLISWMKAFFIAAVVYNLQVEYRWSLPLCFVMTGLASVFGSETIKSAYNFMMRRILSRPVKEKDGS